MSEQKVKEDRGKGHKIFKISSRKVILLQIFITNNFIII